MRMFIREDVVVVGDVVVFVFVFVVVVVGRTGWAAACAPVGIVEISAADCNN